MIENHNKHFLYQKQFDNEKRQALSRFDRSMKGSIDEPIKKLLDRINGSSNFYTTSSCSGRIIVVSNKAIKKIPDSNQKAKKDLQWQFVTHSLIDNAEELIKTLIQQQHTGLKYSTLKFESFILHVRCRSIDAACNLLHCSIDSGQRNSGLMISNTGHLTVAIRNTLNLEVPLIVDDRLVVSEEYLQILINIANDKMRDNLGMIKRFETKCEMSKIFS